MKPFRFSKLAALLVCVAFFSQACSSAPSTSAAPSPEPLVELTTLPPTAAPTQIPTDPPPAATATSEPTPLPATALDFRGSDEILLVADLRTPGGLVARLRRWDAILYTSQDGGETWSMLEGQAIAKLPAPVLNRFLTGSAAGFPRAVFGLEYQAAAVAVDPEEPGKLYAVDATGQALSTRADGGAAWMPAGALPAPVFEGNAVMTADPAASGILYLNTQSTIYKSIDGGASWREINAGFPKPQQAPFGLELLTFEPLASSTLYFSDSFYGLYRSTNGGEQWEEITRPELQPIASLAVDPQDANRLYLVMKFVNKLYTSSDGGKGWTELSLGLPANTIHSYLIDPLDPAIRYAVSEAGQVSGLYKSTDGGETWSEITATLAP